MSFSNGFKDRSRNPASAWIQMGFMKDAVGNRISDDPVFHRYDKDLNENVVCDLSKGFVVLDPFIIKIVGFNQKVKRNVISNEVRSISDKLTVVSYLENKDKKVWFEGSYTEFKDSNLMQGVGAKYANSIYIAIDPALIGMNSDESMVIANITASGASCDGWMSFSSKIKPSKLQSHKVVVNYNAWISKTQGDVHYKVPSFEFGPEINTEEATKCVDLDILLQEYLKEYFNKGEPIDHSTSQVVAYEEASQENEEDILSNALAYKLKNGKTLNECDLNELKSMAEYLKEKKVNMQNETCKNIHIVLEFKIKQNATKASPFEKFIEEEEEDDIPF